MPQSLSIAICLLTPKRTLEPESSLSSRAAWRCPIHLRRNGVAVLRLGKVFGPFEIGLGRWGKTLIVLRTQTETREISLPLISPLPDRVYVGGAISCGCFSQPKAWFQRRSPLRNSEDTRLRVDKRSSCAMKRHHTLVRLLNWLMILIARSEILSATLIDLLESS